jgi:hypothetical protein
MQQHVTVILQLFPTCGAPFNPLVRGTPLTALRLSLLDTDSTISVTKEKAVVEGVKVRAKPLRAPPNNHLTYWARGTLKCSLPMATVDNKSVLEVTRTLLADAGL